jgi:hypothetical protein
VPGDWNGDGIVTPGVFDPSTATFYLRNENSPGTPDAGQFVFGMPGNTPVSGHFMGGSVDGIGVVDTTSSNFATWTLRFTANAGPASIPSFQFGAASWIPLVGDWTGSGTDGIGMYDPTTSTFYLKNTPGAGAPDFTFVFGTPGSKPVVGDWNGMGKTLVGVATPTSGVLFYSLASSNASNANTVTTAFPFGLASWTPIGGAWGARPGTTTTATPASAPMVQPETIPASAPVSSPSPLDTALANLTATGADAQLVSALDQLFATGLKSGSSSTNSSDPLEAVASNL